MKQIHNIAVSVFIKEKEDFGRIKSRFLKLFPFDIQELKLLTEKRCRGFNERQIRILEVRLVKQSHIRQFMKALLENLSDDQKALLLRQADSRLDEDMVFFFRLDKQKLLDSEYWLTDSGGCFHIKINLAVFPKKKEKALKVICELFA